MLDSIATADVRTSAIMIVVAWACMVIAVLIDLWTGIDKARARGEDIKSRGMRRTVVKIVDYWRVQVFGLFFDGFCVALWGTAPFGTLIITTGCVIIELRSVVENLAARRSAAGEIVDVVAAIRKAKADGDARAIIDYIKGGGTDTNKDDGEG